RKSPNPSRTSRLKWRSSKEPPAGATQYSRNPSKRKKCTGKCSRRSSTSCSNKPARTRILPLRSATSIWIETRGAGLQSVPLDTLLSQASQKFSGHIADRSMLAIHLVIHISHGHGGDLSRKLDKRRAELRVEPQRRLAHGNCGFIRREVAFVISQHGQPHR